MMFTRTMTVDGVTAEVDFVVDEAAIASLLGTRAMRNRTGRSRLSRKDASIGLPHPQVVLVAEVRKHSKRQLQLPHATAADEDNNDYHED